jgi:phosphomannomutase
MLDAQLAERARAWAAADPDAYTRANLEQLLTSALAGNEDATHELQAAFAGELTFGTAGLRAPMGPGPARMNRVVVMRAAAGLAAYLREQHPRGCSVVIGFDARHQSDAFAQATAQVLAGAGLSTLLLPKALPTPVLAFAIRYLGCAAGVMVTASHNPAQDNGYKVYLGDGCQIVPPVDTHIAAAIHDVRALPVAELPSGDDWVTLGDDIAQAYLDAVIANLERPSSTSVSCVYTPLHGVGGELFARAMQQCGLPAPINVFEQFAPDPDFPTVVFPNPEEAGAMDLALALAESTTPRPDLVIAHDPDADRCAVAVPTQEHWRMLSGDELGTILGWWSVQTRADPTSKNPGSVLAQSLVSSTLLERIASAAGLGYERTLTGFKWIGRVPDLRFGYEEALGYCTQPTVVRDKDGIAAALTVLACAASLRDQQRTLLDVLDEVALEHGVYLTAQVSIRLQDTTRIQAIMDAWRRTPPMQLGNIPVQQVVDLAQGWGSLPPTDGLVCDLGSGSRVVIRPSGTEPKVKCYLQVVQPLVEGQPPGIALAQARQSAEQQLDQLRVDIRTRLETW